MKLHTNVCILLALGLVVGTGVPMVGRGAEAIQEDLDTYPESNSQ